MKWISILIFLLVLTACKENQPDSEYNFQEDQTQLTTDQSITINQYWVRDESFKIDQYVERHGWDAIKTESGIRYYIYENGDGIAVEKGMLATLDFEIRLMNSDTASIYSSDGVPESFLVERDNVESGLHEALKYLHVGDKAIIILPHFAAHGLLGDMNRIPPLSAVVYDINVIYAEFPR